MKEATLYDRSVTPTDSSGFQFDQSADQRISTGSVGADVILNGGFLANTINLIIGQPGSGKTIFSQQMMYAHAASGPATNRCGMACDTGDPSLQTLTARDEAGGSEGINETGGSGETSGAGETSESGETAGSERMGLYLSTLSEPQGKVVRFVQKMKFFDREALRDRITYHSLGNELRHGGAEEMPALVSGLIERYQPQMLVIDSFKAVRDLSDDTPKLRRMMYDLANVLTSLEVTSFFVGEYGEDHYEFAPEFTVADSIVQLLRRPRGLMDERFFRVHKFRGSDYHAGMHATSISDAGIQVHPRLVTPSEPPAYSPTTSRVSTGVPGLDPLVGGGFWQGSTTLIMGTTGAGKTTMGLQFVIDGLRQGESVLYVNFQENPIELQRNFDSLVDGQPLSETQLDGLHLIYKFPIEMHIDSIVEDVLEAVHEKGVTRVVIDAIDDLEQVSESRQRLHDFLFSMAEIFTLHHVTSLFTLEGTFEELVATNVYPFRVSQLSDTLITLTNDVRAVERRRLLRVVKSRNSEHTERAHPIQLDQSGIRILPLGE